jgi:hypothetical protein
VRHPAGMSAVTERAHRRLVQSVAESNRVDLDAAPSPSSLALRSPAVSFAAAAFSEGGTPGGQWGGGAPHQSHQNHHQNHRNNLADSPHYFASDEHSSSHVWERAFSAVLKEVLPGVRRLMRSKPMRMLEITNPEDWARREHAKTLLAAKAAAEVAAKEAEAKAAEVGRMLREKLAVKKAATGGGGGGGGTKHGGKREEEVGLCKLNS